MLTPEQEAQLLALMEYEIEPLEDFILRVSPHHPPQPHMQQLIRLFERTRTEEVRATVSMPPRHAKTTMMMHGLAWRIANEPRIKHAFASYGADLAHEKSREIRNLVLEAGTQLSKEHKAVQGWKTVSDSILYACGVDGALTGKGITGVIVIDDPIKNRKEAESPTVRDTAWDFLNDVVYTRLEPGSSCIVVATRWHPDDLIGRLHSDDYEHGEWERINIPAIGDGNGNPADERLTSQVQVLWPEQFDLERLMGIRKQVGEYTWASLYQGQPTPKGASIFTNPARYDSSNELVKGARYVIGVDPAATASTKADYSVAVVMSAVGYQEQMRCRIHDVLRVQVTIPELCRQLGALQKQWNVPMAVEAVGAFKAIPQILKETDPSLRLLPVPLKGDKFARAQPFAAAWNDGRIELPLQAPWVNTFLSEHLAFTGVKDKNDDQVDAATHAYMALYNSRPPRKSYRDLDFLPMG